MVQTYALRVGMLVAVAGPCLAQTVTVTTTADVIDINTTSGTIANLPGPDGVVSLSEALIATNNTPGPQTIAFAVPTSDPGFGWVFPGRFVFRSSIGFYWRALDEVVIDATTQTAFTGDTYPGGNEVVLYSNDLRLIADNCTLRGLEGSNIAVNGSNSLVENNTNVNVELFGGSGSTVRDNTGGTIKIDRSNDNVVVGNTMQRVRIWGFSAAQPAINNRIGGPAATDRNILLGYGTHNSQGLPAGAAVQLFATVGTIIENNSIGTTADGMAQGNVACTMGITFETDNRDAIIRDNRIAGILGRGTGPHHAGQLFGWAVHVAGAGQNIELRGNTIGLDAAGQPTLGSVVGVDVGHASAATVTDLRLVDNVIAGHRFDGLRVGLTVRGVRVSATAIHANGGLGIDLQPTTLTTGVTVNDPGDGDTGANGLQNFPVLGVVQNQGNAIRVRGTLDSIANSPFEVDVYANPMCDPSGHGEGERWLGSARVQTDASGQATFDLVLALAMPLPAGWVATATATLEPEGSTSEFSACVPVQNVTCQTDLGFAGPGAATLSMCGGDLTAGTSADIVLAGAPRGALALLGIGAQFNPTPQFGGTIVPWQPFDVLFLVADPTGTAVLPGVPGGSGPAVYFIQCLYLDAAQSSGWGLSNALRVDMRR